MLVGFGLFLLTFAIAVSAVVCAAVALEAIRRARGNEVVEETPAASASSPLLRDEKLSSISIWEQVLNRFDIAERIGTDIARADLSWSVGRVTLLMLLCGAAVAAVASRQMWMPGWMVGGFAVAAGFLPWVWIRRRATRRMRKFEEQFPDALDSLARAMRAGHPFSAALDAVASEAQEPVASEIARLSAEGNLATSWNDALESFTARVPLLEVNLFVAAVQLHMRTGGRLSRLLEQLSETMREAVALRGEIGAAAAHGKLTGLILTALPIVIVAAMLFVNPSYMSVLLQHPWGKQMICAAICCLALAQFVIRRLVDIRV